MINYYYWFSCLAYHNIYNLGPNKYYCEQILSTWKVVFNKEYRYNNGLASTIKESLDPNLDYNIKNKEFSLNIF